MAVRRERATVLEGVLGYQEILPVRRSRRPNGPMRAIAVVG
jgi:hypothetical protein